MTSCLNDSSLFDHVLVCHESFSLPSVMDSSFFSPLQKEEEGYNSFGIRISMRVFLCVPKVASSYILDDGLSLESVTNARIVTRPWRKHYRRSFGSFFLFPRQQQQNQKIKETRYKLLRPATGSVSFQHALPLGCYIRFAPINCYSAAYIVCTCIRE